MIVKLSNGIVVSGPPGDMAVFAAIEAHHQAAIARAGAAEVWR